MNTSHLPYILAIASTGSLSAAARQLGISQPALTKYLKRLEGEVGMELFFQNQKKYVPTPAGRLYLQTAQRILAQAHHAKAAIAALEPTGLRELRVGVSPNRGISLMTEFFPAFNRRYPQVQLSPREGYANNMKELLLRGELDSVISTHAGPPPSGLDVLSIYREELVLAVPSFHPAVHHTAARFEELPFADLRDFQNSIFILPAPSATMYELILSIFAEAGFQPQMSSSIPNIAIQAAMIRGGTRVGFLPAFYVRPDPELAFFRVHSSVHMTLVYLTQAGHTFDEPERYLLYLLLRHHLQGGQTGILWNDFFRQILWEFDPIAAAEQGWEVPV